MVCTLAAPAAWGVIRDGGEHPANLGQGGWLHLLHNATNHLAPNNIATATSWTAVSTSAGNGPLRVLTDPAAAGSGRFYRVRQW